MSDSVVAILVVATGFIGLMWLARELREQATTAAAIVARAQEAIAQNNQESTKNVALLMEAFLKQSQGLQALAKLKDIEDEKLRAILAKFGEKPAQPSVAEQVKAIREKAERQGFTIDARTIAEQGEATQENRAMTAPMTPPPEPEWDDEVIE